MLWSREYGTGGRQSIGGQTSFIAELQLLHGDFAEERPIAMPRLATFRRKIGGFMNFDQWRDAKRSPSEWPTGSAGREIAGADLWD